MIEQLKYIWEEMHPMLKAVLFLLALAALSSALRADPRDTCAQQVRLKALGFYEGEVDCIYGPDMARAVAAFQRANGLDMDGVVGEATADRLFRSEDRRPEEDYHDRNAPVADETAPASDRRELPQCGEMVSTTGPIGFSKFFARRSAIIAWKTQAGSRYGTKYVEWEHAREKFIDCNPACNKCTVRFECDIRGIPCQG